VRQEVIAIRRTLAVALPDRYHPDLAFSLSALGDVRSALGRATDAEAARCKTEELA
jgi:hypothetical protein